MQRILKSKIITAENSRISTNESVLGIIEYGTAPNLKLIDRTLDVPYQFIEVEHISENYAEVWYTSEEVEYSYELCDIAQSDSYCFLSVSVETDEGYIKCTEDAYERLLHKLNKEKYIVIRFWNYIPDINEKGECEDVYKEFCHGRENIFNKYFEDGFLIYPAATGIGCKGKKLCISLIAVSKQFIVKNIENPSQTPAFKYPKQYGNSSPKFSRATYFVNDMQQLTVLSGTASIVGSQTIGINNITIQTSTTIENISILLSDTNLNKYGISDFSCENNLQYLKIYIKNWNDYPIVKRICENKFCKKNLVFQQNDICRDELMVEIEGVFSAIGSIKD